MSARGSCVQSTAFLAALPILLLAIPHVANASRELLGTSMTIKGEAEVLAATYPDRSHSEMLFIRTSKGPPLEVQVTREQVQEIHTGMTVQVTGVWTAPDGLTAADSSAPLVLSASSLSFIPPNNTLGADTTTYKVDLGEADDWVSGAGASHIVRSTNRLVTANLNVAIIPVVARDSNGNLCPGTGPAPASPDEIRKVVFSSNTYQGKGSVSAIFNKCSYGKTQITEANSIVTDVVEIPCSGRTLDGAPWTTSRCLYSDYNAFGEAANAKLSRMGVSLRNYKYRVYLLPPGPCGFVGMGQVGCNLANSAYCRSWIGPRFWKEPQSLVHEIGHNLFLGHSGGYDGEGKWDEFGDDGGVMGYCCFDRCWNTPHAWQMGWLAIRHLDDSNFKPGRTVVARLLSQSKTDISGIRIVPSWVPNVPPIFIGYRTRSAGDGRLEDFLNRRVHVYTSVVRNTYTPAPTTWEKALTAGKVWTHRATGIVIRVRKTDADLASVTICRPAGAETVDSCSRSIDNDCNGLAGGYEPACRAFGFKMLKPRRQRRGLMTHRMKA